jgi:predicted lipoprotein with Yx(FWY)xxD motif
MMENNRLAQRTQLVASLLLLAVLISACGGAATSQAPPPTEAATDQPTAVATAPPTEAAPPPATATPEPAMAEASATTVATGQTGLGTVLVNPEGLTLYAFTQEADGQIACTGGCLDAWPPLLVDGQPAAGDGVDASLLSTVERPDGSTQASYNGMPLYLSSDDAVAGDTNGQGFNDVWFAVAADGSLVMDSSQQDSGGVGSGGLY